MSVCEHSPDVHYVHVWIFLCYPSLQRGHCLMGDMYLLIWSSAGTAALDGDPRVDNCRLEEAGGSCQPDPHVPPNRPAVEGNKGRSAEAEQESRDSPKLTTRF